MNPVMSVSVLVVEHEASTGLSLMADELGPAARVVRPYLGEPLPELVPGPSQWSGLIVLGGSMSAWDDDVAPWLPATRSLIRDAVRTQLPTLGICLGGQLLAAACGGVVERGAGGLELGLVPVTALPAVDADPYFSRVRQILAENQAASWSVPQYHYDAVVRLPAEAELMLTGSPYPNQGFRVGPAAWGVQYHPEASTELFTEWVESALRSGELPAEAVAVLEPIQAGAVAQALLAAAHARAFLDVALRTG